MANNWTAHQKLAIDTRKRDVLVTASAGTGKTAVLSERCVEILTDETSPVDVSRVLVLTFTDAAAEEMRSRIGEKLRAKFVENHSPALSGQLLGLDAAYISTIHSFCKRVITEHFYLLGIDPVFRIIDADEMMLLKFEVLEKVIEQAWGDESLSAGLKKLFYRRNIHNLVSGFVSKIVEISGFLDSVVSREDWFQRAIAFADTSQTSELAQKQKEIIESKLIECKEQLAHSVMLDQNSDEPGHWTEHIVKDLVAPVNSCIEKIQADDLNGCVKIMRSFEKGRFRSRPKEMTKDDAEFIKAPAVKAIKTFQGLLELALVNPDYEKLVGCQASLQTKVLVELVKRFIRAYDQAKQRIGALDFADLQRLMLKLLNENEDVAARLKEKFQCIFVDEYQDINALQQGIIDKIRRDNNVFVVGDVKQSIYAFRQGKPELFLDMLKGAVGDPDKTDEPLKVGLSDNFRSRKGVLDLANAVFNRIMNASVSLVDYDEQTFLREGFDYKPIEEVSADKTDRPLVEIYIADEQAKDDDDELTDDDTVTSAQRQAAFIAQRIKQLIGDKSNPAEFKVYDKAIEDYRDVKHGDIVILMRSLAHTASEYVEVLRLAGVPVGSQSSAGYFQATEIADCISLLKVLDNPQRDIELAAVLRSPFFKITDTQLAMIKQFADDEDAAQNYYDRVCKYAEDGKDKTLQQKLQNALSDIKRWKADATSSGIADTLWSVFRETGYLSFVGALASGNQRWANLLKMHDRAIQFEGFAGPQNAGSLTRFVEFIEKLLEQGQDWAPAQPDDSGADAVRIMSVHKSKGLEFPVVFLAEMNKRFNDRDIKQECITDDVDTLGLRVIDPVTKSKFKSIAYEVIAEKKKDSMLAEEMRVLYVAMTRAREKLILCASKKRSDCAKTVKQIAALGDEPIRNWQLKSANCSLDWVLQGLGNEKQLQQLFTDNETINSVNHELFTAEILQQDMLNGLASAILNTKQDEAVDMENINAAAKIAGGAMLAQVTSSLSWEYPCKELTRIAAKTSVSELTHSSDEYAKLNLGNVFERMPVAILRQQGKAGQKAEGKLIGTATHLVISELDLNDVSETAVHGIIERLVKEEKITPHVASFIDHAAILGFFNSDLGKAVIDNSDKVLSEWEFTLGYDKTIPDQFKDTENVIVQGIVDMIVPTSDGLIVIDFKTDNVIGQKLQQRANSYYRQMNIYADAAEAILKQKVAGTWLYFLRAGKAVEVKG